MSVRSVEYPETNVILLTVDVGRDIFQQACDRVYRNRASKISVAGFRKGKASRKIIEKIYGEGIFFEDAVNQSYMGAYDEAVVESSVEPVGRPDVEVLDISADGYSFTAKVPVRPPVRLGPYKGLSAPRLDSLVSDEDLEAEIVAMLRRNARLETTDGSAEMGDMVVVDFEGFVDGVAFEGGKGEQYSLELGSGRFIPGFEEQLVGLKAGDEAEVAVTFPDPYQSEDLAGKNAVFHVKVQTVKHKILPDADDEFAKDVSEFDTIDDLRDDVRAKMSERRVKASDDAFETALLDQVIENMEVVIPEIMVDRQVDQMVEEFGMRLASQRINVEMYRQMTGQTDEQMRVDMRPEALRQLKLWLALDAVAEAEGLEIADADVDAEYAAMAGRYKAPEEQVRRQISSEGVRRDLKAARAVRVILDSAQSSEPERAEAADGAPSQSSENTTEVGEGGSGV